MAQTGADLDGCCELPREPGHAGKARTGTVKAKVLVMTGDDDPFIPAEQVDEFKKAMDAAGADYEVIIYPGVTTASQTPTPTSSERNSTCPWPTMPRRINNRGPRWRKFLKEVFNQNGD